MPAALPSVGEIWFSHDQSLWDRALLAYWEKVRTCTAPLEREFERATPDTYKAMNAEQWREFIRTKYMQWKHTDGRVRANAVRHFARNSLDDIALVKTKLFALNLHDGESAIELICLLHGIGPSGATGLLANMFPAQFGTADKFLVEALLQVRGLPERERVLRMDPKNLKPGDAALLLSIMRRKAADNNQWFQTNHWTPRKIDKVLWRLGHGS